MGCWDVYCAICGGPFVAVTISEASQAAKQKEVDKANGAAEAPDADDKHSDDEEDEEANYGYDARIIDEHSIAWTGRPHALGFNLQENQNSSTRFSYKRAFISGEGNYDSYGSLCGDVSNTRDENFDVNCEFHCYRSDYGEGTPAVFPFHRPCMELLQYRILLDAGGDRVESATELRWKDDLRDTEHLLPQGRGDVERYPNEGEDVDWKFDKDALYRAMAALGDDGPYLTINYGDPAPLGEQVWESIPGEEVLVCRPLPADDYCDEMTDGAVKHLIKTSLKETAPAPASALASASTLLQKVRHDPFANLPYDVLHRILELLPETGISTLPNFARASLHANLALRDVGAAFWRACIPAAMPWFCELASLFSAPKLDGEGKKKKKKRNPSVGWNRKPARAPETTAWALELSAGEMRRVYALAEWATRDTAAHGVTDKWFLGIANRRRVWGACGQIAEAYAREVQGTIDFTDVVDEPILEWSDCPVMATVCDGMTPDALDFRTMYWLWEDSERLRGFEEGEERGFWFVAHWDGDGVLVGMEMQPKGVARRLFGSVGLKEDKMEVPHMDWIEGLVLHISQQVGEEWRREPRGLTVCLRSGASASFGETELGHHQRPFMSGRDNAITGAIGYVHKGKICRFGILQAPWEESWGDEDEDDNEAEADEEASDRGAADQAEDGGEDGDENQDDEDENEGDNDEEDEDEDEDDDEEPDHPLAMVLWDHPHLDVYPAPIWTMRDISVHYSRKEDEANRDESRDLLPFSALIWAKDAGEARALSSISVGTSRSGRIVRLDATSGSDEPTERTVGLTSSKGHKSDVLEIDGVNGEMIAEAAVRVARGHQGSEAGRCPIYNLRLATNRGREMIWGPEFKEEERTEEEREWEVLTPDPGTVILGVVVVFLGLGGYGLIDVPGLTSLRFLTMKRSKWEKGFD